KAHSCIERGARLLATNPDNWCPVSHDSTRPGAGATAAFLEASTGRRAYYVGKPNGYMFHRARRKLADLAGGSMPEQIVVIGDTMETDIRGAIEAGLQAYLVLSGSTTIEDVADYVYQPTRVLASVADLTEELKSGKPSTRLDSPVYRHPVGRSKRLGRRYQTAAVPPQRPHPRAPMTR
ncbi:MAG TPA: HAD hydrolase-like protein, partial [Verrucomicrobiae bacterium]|nr:HAD hydrolase-like protein [Verrucomicrobiae bacterium]